MTTWTAIATSSSLEKAQPLADAVEELSIAPMGIACLEIEDGSGLFEVAGYFDQKPDEIALSLLSAVHGSSAFVVSKLDDTDWVAQVRRELTPVRVGQFLIYGRHDRDQVWPSDIDLEIEAAMAFGTGHHGTTTGCLELTENLHKLGFQPKKIADIGTGTGILAMAASRRWKQARIISNDIESISVATAKRNHEINKTRDVRVVEAAGFHHPLHKANAPYDLVYANILARPLRKLSRDINRYSCQGAIVIISGILHWQGAGVLSTFEANGFKLVQRKQIGEWMSYALRKQ